MRTISPLRYPGGKSAMTDLIRSIRLLNSLGATDIAEPFAGGAGASLALLFNEETLRIHLNDADQSIFDFWWTLTHRPKQFLNLVETIELSINEWYKQRDTYRSSAMMSRLQRGFSAFYLNRCNRSGIIINGGPIGGFAQEGKWKIDVRFNRVELMKRCEKIAEYRDRISVSNRDGIEFIKSLDSSKTTYFVDPPYYEKGRKLYLNLLSSEYHVELAETLRSLNDTAWILTYDDCPEIRRLYEQWANIRPFSLRYAAAEKRNGQEILVTPKWMQLPLTQKAGAITW